MRHSDWHQRLTAWLAERGKTPFAPGRHDCMVFAAGAVEAMTGRDLARGWRGYRTLAEGARMLRRAGYADHVALVRSLLPATDRPQPGDVAVVETPEGPGMGIVQGAMIYVVAPVGWGLVPLAAGREFFEVT